MAERVLSRGEIVAALERAGLKPAWLANQIGESRQVVSTWLRAENPAQPSDPTVWQKMSDVIAGITQSRGGIPEDIRRAGIDLAIAVLTGDNDAAIKIAPTLIRELSAPYGEPARKKSPDKMSLGLDIL